MSQFTPLDHQMMLRAVKLAERGQFTTAPNPNVGCVIVRDGEIVGEGFHARAGELMPKSMHFEWRRILPRARRFT
ncbi:hypothetical protein [Vibrio mexicanus]|uniref:hypothetical protein n=1 Tax=Vibrio mexicanus TaxID=1004326 RepID=UPI000A66D0FE